MFFFQILGLPNMHPYTIRLGYLLLKPNSVQVFWTDLLHISEKKDNRATDLLTWKWKDTL